MPLRGEPIRPIQPVPTPNVLKDDDGDGLIGVEELILGTDPNDWDTDGDTLSDAEEVLVHKTNPGKTGNPGKIGERGGVDSDGDGLGDDREVRVYGTNPNHEDTDGDGQLDEFEVDWGFDPKVKDVDADGDGLSTNEESLIRTDPNKWDTDGDTLSDGHELGTVGWSGSPYDPKFSSPLRKHTDADEFRDDEEDLAGTLPNNPTSKPQGTPKHPPPPWV